MYFSPGFSASDIGDVDVIAHQNQLHLFYPSLPNHDIVVHLVSDNGLHWRPLPYALRVGDPGAFDDDQIWTLHIFKSGERFYMLYTALCQAEDGLLQRAGLATSTDLLHWEKVAHNPIAQPDPRWYEADMADSGRADWRDPYCWVEDGLFHALICAHEKDGPQNRRGCVGYFTSRDGQHWEVQPPFFTPRTNSDFEVPTLVKLKENYYLLGHLCAPQLDVYRVAQSLSGPWHRPQHDWILPAGNHAFCPVQWQGRNLLYCWIQADFDWPATRRIVGPNFSTRAISPPREAIALENGELTLRSCHSIWDTLDTGDTSPTLSEALQGVFRGEWSIKGETLSAQCSPGMGIALWPEQTADFRLSVDITLQGSCEAGLIWRSDANADEATQVALLPGRQRIELQQVSLNTPGEPNRLGRGFRCLQENTCLLQLGQTVRLQVIAYGPYIEVSVDDRVLLSHLTMPRRAGHIGLFAIDGSATFQKAHLTVLEAPADFPVN